LQHKVLEYMPRMRWLHFFIAAAILPAAALAFYAGGLVKGTQGVGLASEERPVVIRPIVFRDGESGDILVFDANADAPFAVLKREDNEFLATTVRILAAERLRLNGEARNAAFTLTQWSNGRVTFADPVTGHTVELSAFGHTNAQSFARLLPASARP